MGGPQIRPDELAGSARISGNGTIIWVTGAITSVNRTGLGIYEIGLSPFINSNEHTFTVTPILGFPAEASGSVNVDTTPLTVQTVVGGIAADLDFLLDIKRTRTADGSILPSPPPIPAVAPPPSAGNVTGPASSTDNAIVRYDGTTGKVIQDYTSNAPIVDDTGNVGIGTTTPIAPLHVAEGSFTLPAVDNRRVVISDPTFAAMSLVSEALGEGHINFGNPDDIDVGRIIYRNSTNQLGFGTNATSDHMIIDADGNVGIGTTNPDEILHINKSGGNTSIVMERDTDVATQNSVILWKNPGGSPKWEMGVSGTSVLLGDDDFYIAEDGTTANTRFMVKVGGNVGIGTTSPNTALDINGAFSARGIAAPTVSPAGQSRTYFDSAANRLKVSENNGAFVNLVNSINTVTAIKTGAFAASVNELVRCNPTGGAFTVTLPAITANNKSAPIVVKNSSGSANVITIAKTGGDTIDGAATATISASRGSLTFMSDGANNWEII